MQKFICFREGLGLGSLAKARNEREHNKAQQFCKIITKLFKLVQRLPRITRLNWI